MGERGFGLTWPTHPIALWLPWFPQSTDQAQRPPRLRPFLALQAWPACPSPAPQGWEQPIAELGGPLGSVIPPAPPRTPASVGPQGGLLPAWRSTEGPPHSPCPPTHHPAPWEDPPDPGWGRARVLWGRDTRREKCTATLAMLGPAASTRAPHLGLGCPTS